MNTKNFNPLGAAPLAHFLITSIIFSTFTMLVLLFTQKRSMNGAQVRNMWILLARVKAVFGRTGQNLDII
jgi:hypothetical protein